MICKKQLKKKKIFSPLFKREMQYADNKGNVHFPSYGKMKKRRRLFFWNMIEKMSPKTWAFNWIHPCVCVCKYILIELFKMIVIWQCDFDAFGRHLYRVTDGFVVIMGDFCTALYLLTVCAHLSVKCSNLFTKLSSSNLSHPFHYPHLLNELIYIVYLLIILFYCIV